MSRPSSKSTTMAIALLGLILMNFTGSCYGSLQVNFYKGKCKTSDVETVVTNVVKAAIHKDITIAAGLIRLQFHDCGVLGCDASILIDGPNSEKTSGADATIRGYEVIDDAKAAVEKICPGVVSCADIIIIAAKVAVVMTGGISYQVQTGRRDGTVSLATNVNLPGPTISVTQGIQFFASMGIDAEDMVILLGGGHTVGITHCGFIMDRLYSFGNTGKPDPTMNPSLLQLLRKKCPQNSNGATAIPLNSNTAKINLMDNSFCRQILTGRGVLQIDQEIALDSRTSPTVKQLASNNTAFNIKFGQAMVKLGAVNVLTGTKGQIRKSCRAVNK